MMRILVNAVPLMRTPTGIARYVRCLYAEMEGIPGLEIKYFTGETVRSSMPRQFASGARHGRNSFWNRLPLPLLCLLRLAYWRRHDALLRRTLRNTRFDVYHETRFIPAKGVSIPMVMTMYDLSLIRFQKTHPRDRVWLFNHCYLNGQGRIAHLLTISECMRREIIALLNMPESHVTSAPLAPENRFIQTQGETDKQQLKAMGLPESYYLFVGALEPRKNIDLLIEALARTRTKTPLVLVGGKGWGVNRWEYRLARDSELAARVYRLGHVDDCWLPIVYAGALGLVYPSLYEGFGLPVLEAMASGCPVICSNIAALSEVAGGAAMLVDPSDVVQWAEAMSVLAEDDAFRGLLIRKGMMRAQEFSWQRTAEQTCRVFEQIVTRQGNWASDNAVMTGARYS